MPHPLDREVISDAELEIHAGLLAASYVSENFDGLARTVHHVKTLSCVAGAHLEKLAAQLEIAMGYHSQLVQEIWTEPQDRTTLSTYVTSCHAVSNGMRSFNILQDTMNDYMEVLARQKELADRLQNLLISAHTEARLSTGALQLAMDLPLRVGREQVGDGSIASPILVHVAAYENVSTEQSTEGSV
jgi:hypothetical protein